MIFTPFIKADPFATIGFWDVVDRLKIKDPRSRVERALKAGELIASVHVEAESQFYRVPAEHWNQPDAFMEGEPGETLFVWGSSDIPPKFSNLPLLFFVDEVEEWERVAQAKFYLENGFPSDFEIFEDCLSSAGSPREGLWTFFVVLAWIATRNEKFTAAAQYYCEANSISADRGGPHAQGAYDILSAAVAQHQFGMGFRDAQLSLRNALETGNLREGIAKRGSETGRVTISVGDWADWQVTFDYQGISLIPGYYDFRWPSLQVRQAFPPMPPSECAESDAPRLPSTRWQAQRVSKDQELLFRFFEFAKGHMPGGNREEYSSTKFRKSYNGWLQRNHAKRAPFKRTAFEKWLGRYLDGWRVQDGRWDLPQQ
jgi:hypothetical protein